MKRKWTWLTLFGLALVIFALGRPALATSYDYTEENCPGHRYGASTTDVQPTCTQSGSAWRICELCGHGDHYELSALGHDWSEVQSVTAATCTQGGTGQRVCSRCKTTETVELAALGHQWSDWNITQAATCTDAGSQSRACTRCSETETQSLPALGHTYSSSTVVREPTCSTPGLRRATCTRCGRQVDSEIATTEHTFGGWVTLTRPTDFTAGVSQRTCEVCGASEQNPVYPDGTLRVGSTGDAVKSLQQILNGLNYDCGTADGIFGGKTMTAVSAFEKANGLTADGIAWPGVISMLSGAPAANTGAAGTTESEEGVIREGAASLQVAFNDYKSDTLSPSDKPVFVLKITNTGEQTLSITGYDPADSAGGSTSGVESWEDVTGSVDGTVDITRLQPGQSYFVRYMARITDSDQQGDSFQRSFTVHATAGDGSPLSGRAAITLKLSTPNTEAHVTVTAGDTPDEPATPGQWVTVPLTVASDGAQSADIICSQLSTDDGWVESPLYITGGDSAADLAPGGSIANTLYIFITPQDGDNGSAERTLRYAYTTHGGEGILTSDEITITVPTAPGNAPSESMSLSLQAGEAGKAEASVGDVITVPLTLTNNGTGIFAPASTAGLEPGDSIDTPTWLLLPGESVEAALNIAITQKDASAGHAERTLSMSGYRLVATESDSATILEADDQGDARLFTSDEITISIPVAAFDGQPALALYMAPADPSVTSYSVGDSVSLRWTLTNTGTADTDFGGIARLYSDAQGNNASATIFRGVSEQQTIPAGGGSISGTDSFTITEGEIIENNTLYLRFFAQGCPVGTTQVCAISNDVFAQIPLDGGAIQITQTTQPEDDREIALHKAEITAPANGEYYTPGEEIAYEITLLNRSAETINDITITDALSDASLTAFDALDAGGAVNVSFSHIVTPLDAIIGQVTNTAIASYTQGGVSTAVMSDAVVSPAGDGSPAPSLMVGMGETSYPANGQYYAQGEAITYAIYVTNAGDEPLADVNVYHALDGVSDGKIYTLPLLAPMETRMLTCEHTVSAEDTAAGSVVNYAVATGSPDGLAAITSHSGPVVSLTGEGSKAVPQKGIALSSAANSANDGPCAVTLTARGNGLMDVTVHTCAAHTAADEQVTALTSAADSAEAQLAAWTMARVMWQTEVDTLYDQLFAAATGESELTVLNERITFMAWLNACEADLNAAMPDQPQEAARQIAQILREKCVTMCYELSTAPQGRTDSIAAGFDALPDGQHGGDCAVTLISSEGGDIRYGVTMCFSHTAIDTAALNLVAAVDSNEALAAAFDTSASLWLTNVNALINARWSEAAPADRTAIAASQTTFAVWLAQRAALLNDLYPDDAATVSEQIMNATAARAMAQCALTAR